MVGGKVRAGGLTSGEGEPPGQPRSGLPQAKEDSSEGASPSRGVTYAAFRPLPFPFAGSHSVNVVPFPTSLLTSMRPL